MYTVYLQIYVVEILIHFGSVVEHSVLHISIYMILLYFLYILLLMVFKNWNIHWYLFIGIFMILIDTIHRSFMSYLYYGVSLISL